MYVHIRIYDPCCNNIVKGNKYIILHMYKVAYAFAFRVKSIWKPEVYIFLNSRGHNVTKSSISKNLVFATFCVEIYAKYHKSHCLGWQALTCQPSNYKWNHLLQMKVMPLSFLGRCNWGVYGTSSCRTRPSKIKGPQKATMAQNSNKPRQYESYGLGLALIS